ncbi:hypothetical protein BDM02DRAFT_3148684 [Thelephora ganbajun]|uniref:Uncharacterized protein n=1 Tax=Thelephora ganbajun TaxID=370292 RepID=A0ACB6Z7S3_THEGA|nr:hypothetical protein BDM02DRAFT_3148684 [Thelephora ganbajun]
MDQALISLTHVCRGWREMFTSRSSLWTRLDFMNVEKTHTYIQRSKSSSLEICLEGHKGNTYFDDAFSLVIPHIRRLKSLTIRADVLPAALRRLHQHAPLLEELDIDLTCPHPPILDRALFNGDLSSLRELRLGGVITLTLEQSGKSYGFLPRILSSRTRLRNSTPRFFRVRPPPTRNHARTFNSKLIRRSA